MSSIHTPRRIVTVHGVGTTYVILATTSGDYAVRASYGPTSDTTRHAELYHATSYVRRQVVEELEAEALTADQLAACVDALDAELDAA